MKPVKILMSVPSSSDATSYYRAYGPLRHLEKSGFVQLIEGRTFDWPELLQADILFMQRPSSVNELNIAILAKRLGVKVWMDYDDLLTQLPVTHPLFHILKNSQKTFQDIVNAADVVTFSTKFLADNFPASKSVVVPNALMPEIERIAFRGSNRKKHLMWRGSNTHEMDVASNREPLKRIKDKYPDHSYMCFGHLPASMVADNTSYGPWTSIFNFINQASNFAPEFGLVPLQINNFNMAKSNIAWIEMTMCGVGVFATKLPEFDKPGVGDLNQMTEPDAKLSYEYIVSELRLEKINNLRMQVISELIATP